MNKLSRSIKCSLPARGTVIAAALLAGLSGAGPTTSGAAISTSQRDGKWVPAVPASKIKMADLRKEVLAATGGNRGVTGDLRLHDFTSATFRNTRTIRVLVPDGYDAPENRSRRYPVLYLNDGQNLFDSTTSVFNPMEWRVDETVHELLASGQVPPLIVVGVDNAGRRDRFKEYFPWVDEFLNPPEPNPQGKLYPAFIVDEVIPFINSRYRTRHDAASTGIGGSSAGGLAAAYAAMNRPGVFGRLLVESPSIYLDNYHLVRDAAQVKFWPERIYFGAGTNESGAATCVRGKSTDAELVRDVSRLRHAIEATGVDSSRIRAVIGLCARHDEVAWAASFPEALRFLYRTKLE